ncbi:MAG: hypothetical protein IKV65_04865 [Erysipelotrichaceae bacterium]|jgi:hypothetical protein|nr:hypothetical protein [Erysipelotrichaceae bacterium]
MNNAIYAAIFALTMGGLYAALYYLNHRTPVPKGCENLKEECSGCSISSCANHPSQSKIIEGE